MRVFDACLLLLLCFTTACRKQEDSTLVKGGYDEAEMAAATARAISEVDQFIKELEKGDGEDFAVKAPIEDNGETEHFWLSGIKFKNGKFSGKIGNDPGLVSNVKFGQEWTIAKGDISDWMFMRDGKMHGNYTMRPLLATMPEARAAMYRAIMADE